MWMWKMGCMSMVPGSHKWGNQIAFVRQVKDFDAMPSAFEGPSPYRWCDGR